MSDIRAEISKLRELDVGPVSKGPYSIMEPMKTREKEPGFHKAWKISLTFVSREGISPEELMDNKNTTTNHLGEASKYHQTFDLSMEYEVITNKKGTVQGNYSVIGEPVEGLNDIWNGLERKCILVEEFVLNGYCNVAFNVTIRPKELVIQNMPDGIDFENSVLFKNFIELDTVIFDIASAKIWKIFLKANHFVFERFEKRLDVPERCEDKTITFKSLVTNGEDLLVSFFDRTLRSNVVDVCCYVHCPNPSNFNQIFDKLLRLGWMKTKRGESDCVCYEGHNEDHFYVVYFHYCHSKSGESYYRIIYEVFGRYGKQEFLNRVVPVPQLQDFEFNAKNIKIRVLEIQMEFCMPKKVLPKQRSKKRTNHLGNNSAFDESVTFTLFYSTGNSPQNLMLKITDGTIEVLKQFLQRFATDRIFTEKLIITGFCNTDLGVVLEARELIIKNIPQKRIAHWQNRLFDCIENPVILRLDRLSSQVWKEFPCTESIYFSQFQDCLKNIIDENIQTKNIIFNSYNPAYENSLLNLIEQAGQSPVFYIISFVINKENHNFNNVLKELSDRDWGICTFGKSDSVYQDSSIPCEKPLLEDRTAVVLEYDFSRTGNSRFKIVSRSLLYDQKYIMDDRQAEIIKQMNMSYGIAPGPRGISISAPVQLERSLKIRNVKEICIKFSSRQVKIAQRPVVGSIKRMGPLRKAAIARQLMRERARTKLIQTCSLFVDYEIGTKSKFPVRNSYWRNNLTVKELKDGLNELRHENILVDKLTFDGFRNIDLEVRFDVKELIFRNMPENIDFENTILFENIFKHSSPKTVRLDKTSVPLWEKFLNAQHLIIEEFQPELDRLAEEFKNVLVFESYQPGNEADLANFFDKVETSNHHVDNEIFVKCKDSVNFEFFMQKLPKLGWKTTTLRDTDCVYSDKKIVSLEYVYSEHGKSHYEISCLDMDSNDEWLMKLQNEDLVDPVPEPLPTGFQKALELQIKFSLPEVSTAEQQANGEKNHLEKKSKFFESVSIHMVYTCLTEEKETVTKVMNENDRVVEDLDNLLGFFGADPIPIHKMTLDGYCNVELNVNLDPSELIVKNIPEDRYGHLETKLLFHCINTPSIMRLDKRSSAVWKEICMDTDDVHLLNFEEFEEGMEKLIEDGYLGQNISFNSFDPKYTDLLESLIQQAAENEDEIFVSAHLSDMDHKFGIFMNELVQKGGWTKSKFYGDDCVQMKCPDYDDCFISIVLKYVYSQSGNSHFKIENLYSDSEQRTEAAKPRFSP